MERLSKAQRACLTAALDGYVYPPITGGHRWRSGREPQCFNARVLNVLTERGYLHHVDIATRRITEAGRTALQSEAGT